MHVWGVTFAAYSSSPSTASLEYAHEPCPLQQGAVLRYAQARCAYTQDQRHTTNLTQASQKHPLRISTKVHHIKLPKDATQT